MEIVLNNRQENLPIEKDILTVTELLQAKSFTYKMLIVRVNDVLIKKENYSTATIKNGDNVQVIHLISGG